MTLSRGDQLVSLARDAFPKTLTCQWCLFLSCEASLRLGFEAARFCGRLGAVLRLEQGIFGDSDLDEDLFVQLVLILAQESVRGDLVLGFVRC